MRLFAAIIVVIVILTAIIGPQALFTVDETQVAIVTRFGKVQISYQTPGLKSKVPFVDAVTYFDKRLLIFDAPPDSLLTKDKKRLIIDVYARGRIDDPQLFRETLTTEAQAASRAVDIVSSELRREIASDNQAEIITTKRDDIMARVSDNVTPKLEDFGIVVIDVRMKRADFPIEIAQAVYERMQAERKRKADKERAEGAEVDAVVRADVDKRATIIRALAQRDASIVRGCGEAEATAIFARAFEQDPEFFSFQRSLEAYRTFLTQNTTVVLPIEGFGQMFEDIRKGVIAGAESVGPASGNGSEGAIVDALQTSCAETSAALFLARDLIVDRADLKLRSTEVTDWPDDGTLGCEPVEGETPKTVPGFLVTYRHDDIDHEIRTNEFGSQVVRCAEPEPESG